MDTVNTCPTPYRVSTITCNGSLGCNIDLNLLYDHTSLSANSEDKSFVWIEFGTDKNRGTYPKKRKTATTNRKSFDNQVTMIYRMREGYSPNIKVFRNGNIQMTGIRCPEDGKEMIERIAGEITRISEEDGVACAGDLRPGDFKIRMINSDFSFDFRIRRKVLHMLLISSRYNTISSFQPGTYPGVKIQYFWNKNATNRCGHCECTMPCYGRGDNGAPGTGDGDSHSQCKKVTISVFESWKILITGATSYEQIDQAYAYIVRVVQDNMDRVRKTAIPCG